MAEACRSITRAKLAGKLRVGDVVATPAGDLEENGFKAVFHVVAPESLHREEGRAAMRGVVSTLLARATTVNSMSGRPLTSIAIPTQPRRTRWRRHCGLQRTPAQPLHFLLRLPLCHCQFLCQ